MDIDLLAIIIIAVIIVVAGLLAIHHWGPGRDREWVRCPERKVEARRRFQGGAARQGAASLASRSMI